MIYLLILLVNLQAKIIFEDNFESLNFSKWRVDTTNDEGPNGQFQLYNNNRSTVYVSKGILNIKPLVNEQQSINKCRSTSKKSYFMQKKCQMLLQNFFPIRSGKLSTFQTFSFKYGRIEVRAKIPRGNWLWPAIWLLPKHWEYGDWPASGEIDVMQSRGNLNYGPGGVDTYSSTLHWGPDYTANRYYLTHGQMRAKSGTYNDRFHVFGLYWDESGIYSYLDDETNKILIVDHSKVSYWDRGQFPSKMFNPWQYSDKKCAPFDKQFFIILNLAIGGTNGYFPDGEGKPWQNSNPNARQQFWDNRGEWIGTWGEHSIFQIDYVKVWDLSANQQVQVKEQKSNNLITTE